MKKLGYKELELKLSVVQMHYAYGSWLSLTTYLWLSLMHLIPKNIKLFAAPLSWLFWFTTVPHKIHVECCVLCWRMRTVLMNIGDVLCQPANKQNEEIKQRMTKHPVNPFTPRNFAPKKAVLSWLSHFPVTIHQKETDLPKTLGPFIREKMGPVLHKMHPK